MRDLLHVQQAARLWPLGHGQRARPNSGPGGAFPPVPPLSDGRAVIWAKGRKLLSSVQSLFPTQRAEAFAVCWLVAQRRKSKQIRPPADHSRQTDERRRSASRFLPLSIKLPGMEQNTRDTDGWGVGL